MTETQPKSWWQTFAGLLTGVAALITAVAGLIVALKQTGLIGPEPAASEIANRTDDTTHVASSASPNSTDLPRARPESPDPAASAALVTARKPHAVTLPGQREYVLGTRYDKARYILLAANVTPQTSESDVLAIKVRVLAEGEYPAALSSPQFSLAIDGRSVEPQTFFADRVPAGESRERDLRFVVAPEWTQAMFRIRVFPDHTAEIPLNLQAPKPTG